jgi:hypothetical protein
MGMPRLNLSNEPAMPDNSGPTLVPPRMQPTAPVETPSALSRWMHRFSLVIYVIFCVEIGLLLAVLPWMRVWTENSITVGYPQLKTFLQQNFVRGSVTGVGLLDIWLGIWEAVHYRESRADAAPQTPRA